MFNQDLGHEQEKDLEALVLLLQQKCTVLEETVGGETDKCTRVNETRVNKKRRWLFLNLRLSHNAFGSFLYTSMHFYMYPFFFKVSVLL
jgi:hypothetical protein